MPVDLDFRGTDVEFSGCTTTIKCPKCGNPLTIPDGKYASNLYGKYLNELSQAYEESIRKIRTNHNFEHGPEFEIAICDTLRLILPDRGSSLLLTHNATSPIEPSLARRLRIEYSETGVRQTL